MAPGSAEIAPDEAERVLAGLEKVLSHFQFGSLSSVVDYQDITDTQLGSG